MPTVPPIDPALADTPAGAFFALMMRADRTFHVEAEGSIEVGNEQAKIALSVSVSGQDQDSTQVLAKRRQRAVTSLIVKDGQSFIRPAGEPWQLSAPVAGLQMDLFGHFGADNWQGLTYVGPSERGGRQLHHLRLPQFDWPALSGALLLDADQGGVVIHGLKIDIWVTDSGAPVIAEMWIDGMARDQGVETDVTYEAEYRFSRVGEPIEIEAPTKVDDGGQTTS